MTLFNWIKMSLATLILTAAAACGSSGPAYEPPVTSPTVSAPIQAPQSTVYALGNGDKLRITVFGEPDLSGEFVVDGSGQISMPLIGEVAASGISIRELQIVLLDQFVNGGYLKSPKISAEVVNYRPYYIMGEVNRPGEYPYISGLTVLNAVATAEGFTYRANKRSVFVRGANDSSEREVRLNSTLQVSPGDTVRIGERLF